MPSDDKSAAKSVAGYQGVRKASRPLVVTLIEKALNEPRDSYVGGMTPHQSRRGSAVESKGLLVDDLSRPAAAATTTARTKALWSIESLEDIEVADHKVA
jgi:hypothetical protein